MLTGMLEIKRRQVGRADALCRVLDTRLEVVLDVFHEKRLGLAGLLVPYPLRFARDLQEAKYRQRLA